jgi:hypothetical protein
MVASPSLHEHTKSLNSPRTPAPPATPLEHSPSSHNRARRRLPAKPATTGQTDKDGLPMAVESTLMTTINRSGETSFPQPTRNHPATDPQPARSCVRGNRSGGRARRAMGPAADDGPAQQLARLPDGAFSAAQRGLELFRTASRWSELL